MPPARRVHIRPARSRDMSVPKLRASRGVHGSGWRRIDGGSLGEFSLRCRAWLGSKRWRAVDRGALPERCQGEKPIHSLASQIFACLYWSWLALPHKSYKWQIVLCRPHQTMCDVHEERDRHSFATWVNSSCRDEDSSPSRR